MRRTSAAALLALLGCEAAPAPTPLLGSSGRPPASSVVPQPRPLEPASSASSAPREGLAAASAAPSPEPLRAGETLSTDPVPPLPAPTGVRLEARWRRLGSVAPTNSVARAAEARPDFVVQIASHGRMRIGFASPTLLLPAGTELLSRADRYGTVLVWPDGRDYRALPPGTLRALVGDRRVDALPWAGPTLVERGEGSRLGHPVRRIEVRSRYGTVALELARFREAGLGGALLCRSLLEFVGVEPSFEVCRGEPDPELPLAATFTWGSTETGAASAFEATAVATLPLDAGAIAVPPPGARARFAGVPGKTSSLLVSDAELGSLGEAGSEASGAAEPGETVGENLGTRTMLLLIDGARVAYVAPGDRVRLERLRPGPHRLEWRSFLGDEGAPPEDAATPASLRYQRPFSAAGP